MSQKQLVGTLIGAGVGRIAGIGMLAGGALGFGIGSMNPTVIYQGKEYPIFIKHRENQPKFHDLHMQNINAKQFEDIQQFFTIFNSNPSTSDIKYYDAQGYYYYTINTVEYALYKGTWHLMIYRTM